MLDLKGCCCCRGDDRLEFTVLLRLRGARTRSAFEGDDGEVDADADRSFRDLDLRIGFLLVLGGLLLVGAVTRELAWLLLALALGLELELGLTRAVRAVGVIRPSLLHSLALTSGGAGMGSSKLVIFLSLS